jgi:branched-chain amino acid transport system substrate-binding protein
VKAVTFSDNSPSLVAPCLALKGAGADVLASIVGDQPAKAFMDSCGTQNYQPIITGTSADLTPTWLKDPQFSKAVATLPTFPWWDTSVPAIANFNKVINQYDPSGLQVNPVVATMAWDTMLVFAAGAKAGHLGDNPTPAQLISGLGTINNETFGGLTPPLNYANGGNVVPPLCPFGAKIANGQFQLLNGGNRLCTSTAEAEKLHNILIGKG